DEAAVDLDDVHGEPLEVAHRRVARTEVVDRERHTEVVERGRGSSDLHVHERRLGELEHEAAWVYPRFTNGGVDIVGKARDHLLRGDVHADPEVGNRAR